MSSTSIKQFTTDMQRVCGSPILRRLVEQLRLARVLARMEQASSSLLQETRLLGLARPLVSTSRDRHNVPDQRARTRARHGLHYEKVPRLRFLRDDAADADRDGAALPLREGPHALEQRLVLVLDDPGIVHGTWEWASKSNEAILNADRIRCARCTS